SVAVNPKTNMIYTNNGQCDSWAPSGGPDWIPQSISAINGTNNQVVAVVKLGGMSGSQPPQPIGVNPTTNKIYGLVSRDGFPYTGIYLEVINGTTIKELAVYLCLKITLMVAVTVLT